MKSLLLYLFLFASCSTSWQSLVREPATTSEFMHLVLDIDWTIVTEIKDPRQIIKPHPRVIEVLGIKYFINEGLEELIIEALKYPDVKISFFSGGKRARNVELLSKIKLKDGKSLKDIATNILSSEELVKNEHAPENSPFATRFKKDLTLISKDLWQITMLDDTPNFVLDTFEKQSDSVFFIGTAFEYFDTFEKTEGQAGEYVPNSYEAWLLNRKKLFILKEAFVESYRDSKRGEGTLLEGMKKRERLLDLKSHKWNAYSRTLFANAMQSLEKYKKINCGDLALELIRL